MPITFEEARSVTNPDATDDARDQAAQAIMAGVAANDQYWNSRGELEALKARAVGHGTVMAPPTEEEAAQVDGPPTAMNVAAASEQRPAVEAGVTDATVVPGSEETAPAASAPVPSPDNPNDAIARLRAQLQNAGINPEA